MGPANANSCGDRQEVIHNQQFIKPHHLALCYLIPRFLSPSRSVTPILSLAIPRDAWVPAQPSQQEVPLSGQQPANNPVNERARQRAAQEKTLWVGTSDGVCFEWSIEGKRVCCDFSGACFMLPSQNGVNGLVGLPCFLILRLRL